MDIVSLYLSEGFPFVRISAPMVRYTKLPFRILVRRHGVDLAYSPMIMGDSYILSEKARMVEFSTALNDRPLIVQFACKTGPDFAQCAEMIADQCAGVDLNCGCPQRWAMEDGYGSALLKAPDLVAEMIKAARAAVPRWRTPSLPLEFPFVSVSDEAKEPLSEIPFSLSVKIRLAPSKPRAIGGDSSEQNSVRSTLELIRRAAVMGVDWVTVHGRTPSQRPNDPANWDSIREIIEARVPHALCSYAPLPIFLNGDINTEEDAWRAYRSTGCNGVMVARGLLANPAIFDPKFTDRYNSEEPEVKNSPATLCREWLQLAADHSSSMPFKCVHRLAYWMLESHLSRVRRKVLHATVDVPGIYAFMREQWPNEPFVETSLC